MIASALVGLASAMPELSSKALELDEALSLPMNTDRLPALETQLQKRLDLLRNDPENEQVLLELAYLFHANGFVDKASALYEWLIERGEQGEERAKLAYLAADALKEKGELVGVVQNLRVSAGDYDRYPLALARLGEAEMKSGEMGNAERHFRSALALDEGSSLARLGLARISESKGELEQSLRELERLLTYEPDNYNAQALMVRVLSRLRKDDNSFRFPGGFSRSRMAPIDDPWLDVLKNYIFDPQRLDFLFLDYFTVRDFETALALLDRMEEIDPNTARYYRYRGTVWMEMKRFDDAAETFREGLQIGGDDGAIYPLLVQSLMRDGLTEEAEAEARIGLRQSGPSVELLLELGRLLFEKEAFDEALELLSEAHEINPYDIEVLLLRARVAAWMEETGEAAESIEKVRQLAPSDAEKLVRASLVYMEAGLFEDAVPLLEQARRVNPNFKDSIELLADAHLQIGGKLLAGGKKDDALRAFDRSLEVLPTMAETLAAKSQLLIGLSRFQEAERTMSLLIESGVVNPSILLVYGDLLKANGKEEAARASWQKALRILGNTPQQASIRAELQRRLRN